MTEALEDPRPPAIRIFVDADACPVKNEVYRVAERYSLKVFVVANSYMNVPRSELIERVIVPEGPDVADGWIADRATATDIVITNDIPLAGRCVKNGASVLSPTGKVFDNNSIGMALATRDLMTDLRSAGAVTRGPPPLSRQDVSRFLSALDLAVVRIKQKLTGQT
ncbi:MAG TPA: YaiI/YqxD family protein [Pseudolabrys sp.]|nr:YaiI/YqxD family protein [Pseudolabrys sp.]